MLCSAAGKKRSQPDTDNSNGAERLEKIGDTTGNGTKGGKTKPMQEIYTFSGYIEVCYFLVEKVRSVLFPKLKIQSRPICLFWEQFGAKQPTGRQVALHNAGGEKYKMVIAATCFSIGMWSFGGPHLER